MRERSLRTGVWETGTLQRKWGLPLMAVIGALLVGFLFTLKSAAPRSDIEQLRAALWAGQKAVEDHNVSALMGLVSKDYKDEMGMNRDRLRLIAMDSFRSQKSTWVTLDNVSIRPQVETAVVTADVTFEAVPRESSEKSGGTYPMTFYFKKEAGYRFLIFPTTYWRVKKAQGANLSLGEDLFSL